MLSNNEIVINVCNLLKNFKRQDSHLYKLKMYITDYMFTNLYQKHVSPRNMSFQQNKNLHFVVNHFENKFKCRQLLYTNPL